jgi:hypothetical protein
MASSDYRQVTTVPQRLGQYFNPVGLLTGLTDVVREVSVPPPGTCGTPSASITCRPWCCPGSGHFGQPLAGGSGLAGSK